MAGYQFFGAANGKPIAVTGHVCRSLAVATEDATQLRAATAEIIEEKRAYAKMKAFLNSHTE